MLPAIPWSLANSHQQLWFVVVMLSICLLFLLADLHQSWMCSMQQFGSPRIGLQAQNQILLYCFTFPKVCDAARVGL